jgi:UDP-N-acetylmuramyl tripeptide synthase
MRLRGGGSALPGLIVERIDPTFLARALSTVPKGVVVITGTNGKTTTTKMVVQLLRAHGLTVFTNPSGSNFTRGIVASLLDHVDEHGHLKADVAVLELDEAHAVHFVRQAPPRFVLVLNVLRDQLDRFGEIDHTARLLSKVVAATTDGVVLNREDSLVRKLAPTGSKVEVRYFGLSRDLQAKFPSDAELHGGHTSTAKNPAIHPGDVTLETVKGRDATFSFGKAIQSPISLQLDGVYNVLNAAGALALARMITGASAAESKRLLHELSEVKPAFGRGETVAIDGRPCEIVLVKNPSGFRLALSSYADQPAATMIAINDNYADGRDMSWLWDVDFASLKGVDTVSGLRAYDMALRLQYDEVDVSHVEPRLVPALTRFIHQTSGRRRIYCTYTAMLTLRRELGRHYHLEAIK